MAFNADKYLEVNNQSSVATPAAGSLRIYSKTDKNLYIKDDTGLETMISGGGGSVEIINRNSDNIMLNAFRIAVNGDISYLHMVDGVMDEYADQTGIDVQASTSATYMPYADYYTNIDTNTKLLLHFNGAENAINHMWGNSDFQMGLNNYDFVYGSKSLSSLSADTSAWNAFSGNKYSTPNWTGMDWESAPYLQYEFYDPTVIKSYCIASWDSAGTNQYPGSWVFQGSHNGVDWKDLHSVRGETFDPKSSTDVEMALAQSVSKYYNIINEDSYKFYRVKFTDRYGAVGAGTAGTTFRVQEIQMFKDYTYFSKDSSASQRGMYPVRDAGAVVAKTFGENAPNKANAALFFTQDAYARTFFKWITPHQNDIKIVPELRQGSNANVDTVAGNTNVYGGTNWRPGGRVSASMWHSSYEPWKCFSRKNAGSSDAWYCNDTAGWPAWIMWEGTEESTCTHYSLAASNVTIDGTPRSWSLMGNSGNEIPELGENWSMVPNMTSNVLPFPYEATASSEGTAAYTAFNGTKTGSYGWYTTSMASPSGWLQIKLDEPRVCNRYSVTASYNGEADRSPSAWTFMGSNAPTASGWDILDTVTGCTGWWDNEEREFFITPTVPYQYYRIDMTANDGDPNYLCVQEFEIGHTEVQVNKDDGDAYEAWTMFDRVTSGTMGWESTQTSGGWCTMVFPNERTIRAYDITANYHSVYETSNPRSWKIYGNNDSQTIDTKFLAHFEGSDGSTAYTSDGLWNWPATFSNSAQIDTDQYKFGSSSLLLNGGTSDYITFPTLGTNSNYDFSNSPLTVDAWIRFSSVTGGGTIQTIVSNYLDANNFWSFYWDETNARLQFTARINAVNRVDFYETWSPSINTWYHVAVIRGWGGNNDRWALTVNGSILNTYTTNSSYCGSLKESVLRVGALAPSYYFYGWIDELRITKGQALWTSNFTVPTAPMGEAIWNELDSQSGQTGWRVNERRSYEMTSPSGCRAYKFGDIVNDGQGTYTIIQELEMFETPWTLLDAQYNTNKWLVEETRLYPVPSGKRDAYKSYRLDISDPYNPGNIMNLGELSLFTEDPGTELESIGDFEIGWGDFTVEGWFMWLEADHSRGSAGLFDTCFDSTGAGVYVYHDGTNYLYAVSNNSESFYRNWRPMFGRWHHIALVRENGACRLFADGKQLGQEYEWNGYIRGHKGDGKLGAYNDITSPFDGYIKEVRYSNVARYYKGVETEGSTSFTPQTTPFVADANTKLLVHGYQENTDMQDYCAYFNDDYDFIGIPYHDSLKLEQEDFTFECHFKMVQTGAHILYASGGPVATTGSMRIYVTHNSQCIVDLAEGSYPFNYQFIQGTWYHLAVVRTNNRLRCYVNGVECGSDAQKGIDVSSAGSINSTTSVQGDYVRIGEDFNSNYFWGYMKNFRVSNIARYTEDFFAPTEEYTSDANTVLLLPMKDPDSLVPAMGGYWQPEDMHVHASTENSNTYRAWKAFNYERRLDASCWLTDGENKKGWLEWEMPSAVTASGYVVGSYSNSPTTAPKDWTLYGTNTRPYDVVSLQNYHMCCVPRMQANVCPGNTSSEWPDTMVHYKHRCSASSEFNKTSNQAFNAFEYEGNAEWRSMNGDVNGAWLMFDFTEDDKRIITQYGMRCGVVANTPTSWIFQASNDLETWVDLDDRNLLEDRVGYPSVWVVNDRKYWSVTNSTAYRYYRIYVREVSTLASIYVTIRDFFLYDGSRGTASCANDISVEGYFAFNGVLQDGYGWRTPPATPSGWLQYDFAPDSAKTITKYNICSAYSIGTTASPKDWTFEGSNSDMLDYAPILNQFDTIALGRYRGDAKATASTTFSDWWPYNAFNHQYELDGGTGGGWSSNTPTNSWLRIELDDPFAVQAYTIVAQLGTLTTLPNTWTFEGGTASDGLTHLLLHCDGSDASTTIPDTSFGRRVLTCVGDAKLGTAQKKFGTASLVLDGTGDYVTIPLNTNYHWADDLNFEGEDFCFEGWFRFNATPNKFTLWGSSTVGCYFSVFNANSIRIYDSWNPADFIEFATSTLATATWYHIAIARDGDNLRVFLDGTQQDSTKDCGGHAYNHGTTGTHQIGAYNGANFFNGWMDEIRISKGTPRYTSNFSVETSAWTDPVWNVLDTQSGQSNWLIHERRTFDFANAVAYKNYRLNISANDGSVDYTRLQELELHKERPTWTVLHTVTNETGWVNDDRRSFVFSNSTSYTSYRLNVTANNGAGGVAVQQLQLFEEQNWQTLDTVTGEASWAAWENRYFDIDSPGSYKYYRFDITDNNTGAYTALSYFQLIPDTHLATDYSSYSHPCWISGEVQRRYHDHWLTSVVKDSSRANENETHIMYHVGTAKTSRTNITGNGSFYGWGTGDRIEMPYHDDFNFYADNRNDGFNYGAVADPFNRTTDQDFTITWWSKWCSDAHASWIDILRYQEGIRNSMVSNVWQSYYDGDTTIGYKYRPALHTWQHYACIRRGDTLYQFVDGRLVASWDCSDLDMSDVLQTYSVVIACDNDLSYYHLGQMDEIQIIKGSAKWTSDFTPPTTETSIVSPSMTLQSASFDADAVPAEARLTVFAEPVDSFAINTNLLGYVSRDDGTTWTQVTLVDQGVFDSSGKHIYSASADISGQPSGTELKYRYSVVTSEVRIHGTGLSWSE